MTEYSITLDLSVAKLLPETVIRRAGQAYIEDCVKQVVVSLLEGAGVTAEPRRFSHQASILTIH